MTLTPLSNPQGAEPLGEFFAGDHTRLRVFERIHRLGMQPVTDREFDGRVRATFDRREGPMSKTSAIAEWALPLLLWIVVMGVFVSLVVAALSTATG